ncbi:uncharacterized protein M421DRAFT_379587 [Didymella exigua CBS 183.55]|uniref:Zn(2)-C6 fungal-type domain-containing protein n=1 Tax=Didymella exigua CBS 183.55 TaxID=1150837 RepID=A0A6A5R8Y5_9PLEO|nr:uncharacterized protein M421DRAFT_379587 [Didymella exigua CBS 183.55]KAF1922277.1 hypothetical protein M421DRAFT_379587 [Didymella exigua CBS 183.55]
MYRSLPNLPHCVRRRSVHEWSFTNMQHRQMATPRIGCATCKGRAISCDGARPHCTNCSRSNRKCHGYGLKLSWPRANDSRRAVVSKSSPPYLSLSKTGLVSDARFVHMSHWDIELNHSLTSSAPVRTLSLLGVPMLCNTFKLEAPDRDLFEYCML